MCVCVAKDTYCLLDDPECDLVQQAEWQLLFHFVLHYPTVVRESVVIKIGGEGGRGVKSLVCADVAIKKVARMSTISSFKSVSFQ